MDALSDVRWGSTKEDVIHTEQAQLLINSEEELIYKASIFGKNINIRYMFHKNKLTRMIYSLTDPRDNIDDYIDDYTDFKMLYLMLLGEPQIDKQWYDEETDASLHLAVWKIHNSAIGCILSIDNAGICCYVENELLDVDDIRTVHVKSLSFNP